MTAPIREQVVQWADDSGFSSIDDPYHNQIEIADSGNLWITKRLETFSTLARADLEATIAEQAAELEVLRVAHRAHEDSNLKMLAKLKQQAHELESLRKDAERYRWLRISGYAEIYLHNQPGVDNCKYIGGEYLDQAIDAAIAAAQKQEEMRLSRYH